MAMSLSDVMKMRQKEMQSKNGNLKAKAQEFAASLKALDIQKKKDAHQLKQDILSAQNLELLREKERQRLEDERKTKEYFSMDKYERKIPAPGEPVYFGDMKERHSSWVAHGPGQFKLNGQVFMKGVFKDGDFVEGEVHWSDRSSWDGLLVDHKMNGIGIVSDANGIQQEALMRSNIVVCYKNELQSGKQIEFEEQVFDVYPTGNRKPTATILKNIRDWVYLCKFHDAVWPQDRQIDLSVTSKFNLLRLKPVIYNLQSFGLPSEPDRIYDYRFVSKVNRSRLRDTANNVIFQEAQIAAMFSSEAKAGTDAGSAELNDDVSTLGGFEEDNDNASAVSTAHRLRSQLGNMKISASQMDMTLEAAAAVAALNLGAPGTLRRYDSADSTVLSTVRKLDDKGKEVVAGTRLYGPSLRRLVPQFPVRDKRDRSRNYFESRMVGIGAAKEEDEAVLQEALKKQQWAKLIEERRAQQDEAKRREIEEQQRSFLEQSISDQRTADQSLKDEAARFRQETEEAIANELRMLSR